MSVFPIVIPAYEPDERLLSLLRELRAAGQGPVILVNDGSGAAYDEIFKRAQELLSPRGKLLAYQPNRGKGHALKTAFRYILENFPEAAGCITADSDGQHTPSCIAAVHAQLERHPESLVLGVRRFDGENIPWKSRFGNTLTIKVFHLATGLKVSDTQTGLRGIPRAFMQELLEVPGERFEFETKMLLSSIGRYPIREIPIRTVYDSSENHQTHFNPVKDSIRIYRLLLGQFFRFVLSSLSSSIIDLALFALFCALLKHHLAAYVAAATVLARIISAVYNYSINYKLVFKSRESTAASGVRYFILAVVQMCLSALLTTGGVALVPFLPEVVVKVVVDTVLFFVSYYIQKIFVFRTRG